MQVIGLKKNLIGRVTKLRVYTRYNYEKIECWMQGVRDYIKYLKRGYGRPSHLSVLILEMEGLMLKMRKQILKLTKDGVQRA